MKVIIPKDDIKRMTDKFTDIEKKQIPFATKYALNSLVSATVNKTKEEIRKKLDWKKNIPYVTKYKFATKEDMTGEVFLNKKSWGWYALKQHFNGGVRSHKGLETFLKNSGFLSENYFLIKPINGLTKQNVSRAIIKDFKEKRFDRFFILTNSKNESNNGIYAKAKAKRFEGKLDTRAVVMLFKIVKKPNYKQRIDLKQIPRTIWIEKGEQFFKKGMEIGMQNADK